MPPAQPPTPPDPKDHADRAARGVTTLGSSLGCASGCLLLLGLAAVFGFLIDYLIDVFEDYRVALPPPTILLFRSPQYSIAVFLFLLAWAMFAKEFVPNRYVKLTLNLILLSILFLLTIFVILALFLPYISLLNSLN